MALSDLSRESLLPSFLYAPAAARSFAGASRLPASPAAAPGGAGAPSFPIQAPKEKIEMYSPAFYAACTAGGIASCGLTHMAVTPLDLVKCNMHVRGLWWVGGEVDPALRCSPGCESDSALLDPAAMNILPVDPRFSFALCLVAALSVYLTCDLLMPVMNPTKLCTIHV